MDVQWPLLIFGLLAGLGMGCLGIVSVSEFTGRLAALRVPGLVIALGALAVGGLASALHMGNPARVLYVLGNLNSGITQELIATAVAGVVILAYFIATVKNASAGTRKVIAGFGIAVAIVLPLITGHAYVQGSRPAWDTLFLPFMYLGAAAAMGAFTMYLVGAVKKAAAEKIAFLGKTAFVASLVFAVSVVLYLAAVAFAPYQDFSRSVTRVLTGDLALLFWGGVVVLGLAVPALVSGMKAFSLPAASQGDGTATLTKPSIIAAGLACLLVGSVAVRMLMYLLGTSVQSFIY